MEEPATAQWHQRISDADFKKLKAGFESRDMDDKWNITVTEQTSSSNISICFARSWTDQELYVLDVKSSDGGSGSQIKAITWEQNKSGIRISEEQAKKEVVILSRSILDCEFEELPEYDRNDVWNHPAARLDAK
ncbi:hypothetical protein CC86DRAFT_308927 [Ophiobolus disseminans]|uniref:Uncharacterized protein n=1 Tax=Ophiobolus disseminans TaxID=1469910 RepID=A0A6A6ZBS9_9PLEO|nr:hypothetical protein CC86DRAFT_308927 [Ophiobolus disseminans]